MIKNYTEFNEGYKANIVSGLLLTIMTMMPTTKILSQLNKSNNTEITNDIINKRQYYNVDKLIKYIELLSEEDLIKKDSTIIELIEKIKRLKISNSDTVYNNDIEDINKILSKCLIKYDFSNDEIETMNKIIKYDYNNKNELLKDYNYLYNKVKKFANRNKISEWKTMSTFEKYIDIVKSIIMLSFIILLLIKLNKILIN